MKIAYKEIPMKLERYFIDGDTIRFVFENDGVKFALTKILDNKWYFGLMGFVPPVQLKTNKLLLWNKNVDGFEEGQELYEFLFKDSSTKLRLLLELGPGAYERYK